MGLENIKHRQKEINKYLYEKMSRGSLDQMWNEHELYDDLKFHLKEIFKWDEKIIKVEKKSTEKKRR